MFLDVCMYVCILFGRIHLDYKSVKSIDTIFFIYTVRAYVGKKVEGLQI